jgi:predicted transcriptional regulator
VATTKEEHAISDEATETKILTLLRKINTGQTVPEIESKAHLRKGTALGVLRTLLEKGTVQMITGKEAEKLNRSAKAKLYVAVPSSQEPSETETSETKVIPFPADLEKSL